tara:strand:+ start:870 stop:1793 length:924 start_codon:yes stop_codon:yes gene_type:complete
MKFKFFLIFFSFLIFFASQLIANDDLCTKIIKKTEINLKIPENLLLSIALTESGRKVDNNFFPWPWSINVKGKGYFLKNKQQLISFAKNNLEKKIKNFDLGCMQINYYYHGHKFNNVTEMVEPESNVLWSGKFLVSLKKKHKTWDEAISRYHSNTKWRKKQYLAKVMNNWTFVGKTTDIALNTEEKNQRKNKISNLSKVKKDKEVKLSLRSKVQKNEIAEEIDVGRNRVKKDKRILENNYYSRFIKQNNLGNKFKNIMEKEGLDKIIIELSDLIPENIDKIQVETNFIYLDKTLIKDNLERIENIKK